MKFTKLLVSTILAFAFLITIQSCQRERGCTDPYASNYNPNAQVDNGTCRYNGVATFYFDQDGPTATVSVNGQTANVTASYQSGAPACGISAAGCANFTLPAGTYPYTASSALSSWNGTVTIYASSCALVNLQQSTGAVTFWTNTSSFGNITVTVTGNGSATVTSYITGGVPSCGFTGCATFDLLPGTYTYSAVSVSGSTWSGTVVVTGDGCQPVELTV